jgi:NADH dehydrogenase
VGQVVTVFGGTGFLGRRVVRHLRDKGFSVRVASRHPRASDHDLEIQPTAADIRERQSIASAIEGAFGVVNAISLYVERGTDTFQVVHVAAAEVLAAEARKAGADDAFLNTLVQLLRRLPVYPMFGRGTTRLQPADVEDVGEMIANLMQRTAAEAIRVECGGPRIYAYEELVRTVARAAKVNRMLVPVPFAAWHALAWVAELLPGAPITRNQVELMEIDTVASADVLGFADFGISPRPLEDVLQNILQAPT